MSFWEWLLGRKQAPTVLKSAEDEAIEEDLKAEPISKTKMDLLWMNESGLRVLEASIRAGGEDMHMMPNGEGGIKELKVTLDDIVWVNEVNVIVEKAATASQRKDYREAIRLYREALKLAPRCDQWLNSIGSCYVLMGKSRIGIKYIERAYEVTSQKSRIRANLERARSML